MNGVSIVIGIAVIAVFIIFLCFFNKPKREGFVQVLGALSPYRYQLSECLRECQYENSMNKFDTGIFACESYCYDKIEKLARNKTPPIPPSQFNTYRNQCQTACENANYENIPFFLRFQAQRDCQVRCEGDANVRLWCQQEICNASPDKNCMNVCVDKYKARGNELQKVWKYY